MSAAIALQAPNIVEKKNLNLKDTNPMHRMVVVWQPRQAVFACVRGAEGKYRTGSP